MVTVYTCSLSLSLSLPITVLPLYYWVLASKYTEVMFCLKGGVFLCSCHGTSVLIERVFLFNQSAIISGYFRTILMDGGVPL